MYKKSVILFFVQLILLISCQNDITSPKPIPEEQFLKLHIYYGFGNELNTSEMKYTKDLVLDGNITVDFWLTQNEQISIINKLNEIDFINLPNILATYSTRDSIIMQVVPSPGRQFIKAKYNDLEKEIGFYFPLPDDNPDSIKVIEIYEFIINIIHNKRAYQNLPEPRGGRI